MRIDATTVADYDHITVEPVTGSIGAEIGGVDLRHLDGDVIAEIRRAWLDHKVLFFRDQPLNQAEHVAYGRALGPLEIHPFARHAEDHPEILVLESTADEFQSAEVWHSDVTFRECPPLGSVLLGRQIPPHGGDTCWANMELAYDLLDDAVKERIEDRVAVHSYVKTFGRDITPEQATEARAEYPDQKHPIVRTHPETGARSLFVNRAFTIGIDGMDDEEARPLLRELYRQAERPEIQCRFRWRRHSIAQWDNRCTQHYAVPDHGGQHRRVERVTLVGDRPV